MSVLLISRSPIFSYVEWSTTGGLFDSQESQPSQLKMSSIKLPEDLEFQALTKFDALVSQGRLFFEETEGQIVEDQGFKVSAHEPTTIAILMLTFFTSSSSA